MACFHKAGSEDAKCGECGTAMEKLYWKHFVPLHFCQILTPGSGFHNHLEIPKKFAKNTRVRLHPEVTLRGPGGATWHAIMNLMGGKVFLSDGWEEFVRAYSLQEGNILVFKYDGISVFDVLIFDGDSLCEKEAAYFVQKCENAKTCADHKRKRIPAEVDVEEPIDVHVHRATKKARKVVRKRKASKISRLSDLYINRRRKKRTHFKTVSAKTGKTIHHNTSVNASNQNEEEPQNTEKDGNFETETVPPNGNDIHRTFATEPPQDAAVIRSGGWISEDETPAEDTRQINETVNVDPSPLARKEVDEGASKGAACSEGRLTRPHLATKGDPSGSADPSGRNRPSGKDALEMARDQATENSFIATMHPSAVHRPFAVSIPKTWYKKHLSPEIGNALLRVGDKTWVVRVSHRTNEARGSITKGWEFFARENRLSKMDVCLFDLTSLTGDTVILDVSIFRARPNTLEETETEVEYSSTI